MSPPSPLGESPFAESLALAAELTSLEDRFGVDVAATLARAAQLELAAAALDDEGLQVRARLLQANMHRRSGDLALASRMCWQANAWAEEHASRSLLARSHQVISAIYDNLGDTASGLEQALLAVEYLDDDMPARTRTAMVVKLADALATDGSIEAARRRYRDAERIAAGAPERDTLLMVLNNFAYAEYLAGDPENAWAIMQRLRRVGRTLTPDATDTLARILIALGRYAEAATTAWANIEAHENSGTDDADNLAEFLLTLVVALRHLGDLAAAELSLEECDALCGERELGGIRVRVLQERAELLAARGDFEKAFVAQKEYQGAERQLISRQREEQARIRHAMFETEDARREAERFREQARRDPLTGLHNRRYVDEHLPALLATADPDAPVLVAMLDLDHFKRINDRCSHEVGDQVLVRVAALLRDAAETGFAARLGGEEFLVAVSGLAGTEAVRHLDTLRRTVAAQLWTPLTGDLPVTISVGAAMVSDPDEEQSAILARADAGLYAAKHAGRNRLVVDFEVSRP